MSTASVASSVAFEPWPVVPYARGFALATAASNVTIGTPAAREPRPGFALATSRLDSDRR